MSNATARKATYVKATKGRGFLVRCYGWVPAIGEIVTVSKKAGGTVDEEITSVRWSGPDVNDPSVVVALCHHQRVQAPAPVNPAPAAPVAGQEIRISYVDSTRKAGIELEDVTRTRDMHRAFGAIPGATYSKPNIVWAVPYSQIPAMNAVISRFFPAVPRWSAGSSSGIRT